MISGKTEYKCIKLKIQENSVKISMNSNKFVTFVDTENYLL